MNATPHNPTTGAVYSGQNPQILLAAQNEHGYETAQWAGYGQWRAAGRQVRKGEKSTRLKRVVKVKCKRTGEEKIAVKSLRVFNLAQTDAVASEKDAP